MLKSKHLLTGTFLAVALMFFLTALLLQADQVTSGPFYETKTIVPPNSQIPPISATISYELTAEGSISALNPITVIVTISDANNSDLSQYYQAIGFYGSIFNSNSPTNSTTNSSTLQMPGFVKFGKQPDGTYNGTGNLIWPTDSDVYTFFIPQPWYVWKLNAGPQNGEMPITNISGIADTLSWKDREQTIRLALISCGFGVLLIQPAVKRLNRQKEQKKSQMTFSLLVKASRFGRVELR